MSELVIDLAKLGHNIRYLSEFCSDRRLDLLGIVKGCFSNVPIIQAFQENGIDRLGISKVAIVRDVARYLKSPPVKISLSTCQQAEAVVHHFDTSYHSEIAPIHALADACSRQATAHDLILVVDIGDLREGVLPEDVQETVGKILEIKNNYLSFRGLAASLTCCSGTLPDEENILVLHQLSKDIEARFGCQVKTVSIGGSVVLSWMQDHDLPWRINEIRLGEAILLGTIPSLSHKHESLYDDAFTFRAEVLEVREKPSMPKGVLGLDSLGGKPYLRDRGIRKRAILDFGLVDTAPMGLIPRLLNLEFVNTNSEYAIVDVTDCSQPVERGDIVEFGLKYIAMIQCFISPHVDIKIVDENVDRTSNVFPLPPPG
jgi:predicted amino acid racemase